MSSGLGSDAVLEDVVPGTATTARVSGGRYRGLFETTSDVDWVGFDLEAGVTYTIRGLGSDSDNGTAQYVGFEGIYSDSRVRQSDNPEDFYQIRQASDGYFTTEAQTEFTPGASGTYFVEVNSWGIDIGSYTIYVTEDVIGGDGDEVLEGTARPNWMLGGRGNDVLTGGGGDDLIDGEWGDDTLTGGAGADIFRFYSDNWDDIRDYDADLFGQDVVTDFDPAEDMLHFAGRIIRGLQDLTITESGGDTTLTTSWGDSVTLEGVAASALTDAHVRTRVGVRIEGGNIEGADGDDVLTGSDDRDDIIYGFGGDDVISGGAGDDYLRGFDGDDTITGGDGNDVIGGEDGNDQIDGGAGDDFIIAEAGNDWVDGGTGDDLIETRGGNDTLVGGAGGDTLRGGRGDDDYSGGSGVDVFVIGRGWGDDIIRDFDIGSDILDFQGSGFNLSDLSITGGASTTISADGNSLTLDGVALADFQAAAADVLLEAGSVTSHYSEYDSTEFAETPTSDILVNTGVIVDSNEHWEADADGITRVSFSFLTADSQTVSDDGSTWWTDAVEAATPLAQFVVEQEIRRIESYTNLDLVWVEDGFESGGNIRMGFHQFVIGGASSAPYEGPYSAEVYIGIHVGEEFQDTFFVHELGHSLGFDDLPYWNEVTGQDYTIMSYIKSARHEFAEFASADTETYQYADLAALQYLYGVDTETTAGNDKFSFDLSETMLMTIFDAGGTDTIAVTGTGAPVHIDLTPGSWSDIGPNILYEGGGQSASEPGTLFIMPNTTIENASGSTGSDTLTGNDADNVLRGFDGADSVTGGAGGDTVWAGAGDTGDDSVDGGSGDDLIAGGAGDDMLIGGLDRDTLFGGTGDDMVILGTWTDSNMDGLVQDGEVSGGDAALDIGYTGSGDDRLFGSNGHNSIGGGEDSDYISGLGGDDTIYGGKGLGRDTLVGGAGGDTVFGGGGDDDLTGGSGGDLLFNGAGNDTVRGGSEGDTLWGGGGDDLLTGGIGADVFAFGTANGNDTVTDFTPGEDSLLVTSAGFADFDAFLAAASDGPDGVTIAFAETTILLQGLSLSDLSAADVMV